MMQFSLIELWSTMGPLAKGVMLLLVAMSLISLSVAFERIWKLSRSSRQTAQFLASLPSPFEGGIRANDRIPAADLLSTFTGTWTLDQLVSSELLDWPAIRSSCPLG